METMTQGITRESCEALEQTDIDLIKRLCPVHEEEGLTWYDISTSKVGLSVKYLRMRGKLIIHPCGVLVRFK